MIVKIQGGIGNQLFQYAFILGVGSHCNGKIHLGFYFDNMKYPRQPLAIFKSFDFEVSNLPVKPNTISWLYNKFRKSHIHYLVYCLNEKFGNIFTETQEFGFRKVLIHRNLNEVFLNGYFADFRYMSKGLLEVKCAFEKLTTKLDLTYDQHIAIHIRRGDYTRIMRTHEKSNVLEISYYKNCLNRLKYSDAVLRVYTDDYIWAKSELPILFAEYNLDFSPEEYSDVDSLWTMSNHKYLIGANSTFSLWAYYFGMDQIQKFYYPLEWATSIQQKGYNLFSHDVKNVELIGEFLE